MLDTGYIIIYEADEPEVARCIRDGKDESASWGHSKSLPEMSVFDEVRPGFCSRVCRCGSRVVKPNRLLPMGLPWGI